jgi:hypothetical protein
MLFTGVMQCPEYYSVTCIHVFIQVIFTDFIYMVFFQCVRCFRFLCVLTMTIVSVAYLLLSSITIIISNCLYMYFVSSVECSVSVLCVLVGSLAISFGKLHFVVFVYL